MPRLLARVRGCNYILSAITEYNTEIRNVVSSRLFGHSAFELSICHLHTPTLFNTYGHILYGLAHVTACSCAT